MPVRPCPNGKWRIGDGDCIYPTQEKAIAAYKGYLSNKKHKKQNKKKGKKS